MIGIFLSMVSFVDESRIHKVKKIRMCVGVCLCYGCEFLNFFLSKVVSDNKFNIKLTVTNRDCSDNLQETLQQLQSRVSKRNKDDLQKSIEKK